jgi:L-alanine-DL-glutamate epimerase-like enolase superfamily enzyme
MTSHSSRRQFLQQLALSATLPMTIRQRSDAPDAKITRIRLSTLQGRFHKVVAMNSYDDAPKGQTYEHTLIRVETDAGVEGIAPGSYWDLHTPAYARQLQPLIGVRVGDLYAMQDRRVIGRQPAHAEFSQKNRVLDCAFFDILGKLTHQPIWKLIGDEGKEQIPVYDGTAYFSDVMLPDRGVQAVADECAEAARAGYWGVKIKLGRGSKWMRGESGDRRDVEVTLAARKAIGPHMRLMADPNYGYEGRYDDALKLMRAIRPANLLWMEEIFPETVEHYIRFRADLRHEGNSCGIAFGEHMRGPAEIEPYLAPTRLVDFVQYDIRTNNFLDSIAVGRRCAQFGVNIAPHNWASQLGSIMAMHLARALPNCSPVESDRSTCEVLRVEPLHFTSGCVPAPSLSGLGVSIDEDVYRAKLAPSEIVVNAS